MTNSDPLIGPTSSSVRDRLAAFFHWGDQQSLYTAADVARSGDIDFDVIERWSKREGSADKFIHFRRLLQGR